MWSGGVNDTVNKASASHGNNKQPRLNLELDFRLDPQMDDCEITLQCRDPHSECVGCFHVQPGRSTFGKAHAFLSEAIAAGCISQLSVTICVQCRSTGHHRHVSRAELQCGREFPSQHQCSHYHSQRDGLTVRHTSASHIQASKVSRSSTHDNADQVAARGISIMFIAACELGSDSDICQRKLPAKQRKRSYVQSVPGSTKVVAYIECGKFQNLITMCALLGVLSVEHHWVARLAREHSQVQDAGCDEVHLANGDKRKLLHVHCSDGPRCAGLANTEQQLLVRCVSDFAHACVAIQYTAALLLILAGFVQSVYAMHSFARAFSSMLIGPATLQASYPRAVTHTQPPYSKNASSRPGPKSGSGIPRRSVHALLLTIYFCIKGATGVKVAPPAVGGAEGGQAQPVNSVAPPKPYGYLPTKTALLQDQVTKTTKRSFKRACRRALMHGQASYRGSTITMKMIQPSWLDCNKVAHKAPNRNIDRKGLRVFCWNSGGMASGQLDEFLLHIDPNIWDILLIQETHWAESSDFATGPWNCIASGAGRGSQAGVMIMIHQRLCHNALLRVEHVLPGRILRVRLPLPGKDLRHLQLLCAYQKAWNSQQASSVIEQRAKFWNKLDAALASAPDRDVVLLGGDLNLSVPVVVGASGAGVSPPPKDGAPDVSVGLWNGKGTPVHTFQFGKYRAQLDFILRRALHADGVARQSRRVAQVSAPSR